jgi:LmbE family N-acetylglucosaminyl deacetylase
MHILAIGAHPDDAEIFMGGSLAAWGAMGARLTIAVATDGAKGGAGDPEALAVRRAEEARAAAALLGAELFLLGFPDGGLRADMALIDALARLVRALEPDLVLTHDPADYHADHRTLSRAVDDAVGFRAPVLFADTRAGVGFVATHWIDTTAHQDVKAAAIRCHQSQDPDRFVTEASAWSRDRAAQCGHDGAAEAWRFTPRYPFCDIRDLLPPAPPVKAVKDRSRAG